MEIYPPLSFTPLYSPLLRYTPYPPFFNPEGRKNLLICKKSNKQVPNRAESAQLTGRTNATR